MITTVLSMIPYLYLCKFFNELLVIENTKIMNRYALWIFIFMVLQIIIYFLSLYCKHVFAFRVERNLKIEGLNNLLNTSFSFFDTNPSGKIREIIDDGMATLFYTPQHLNIPVSNETVWYFTNEHTGPLPFASVLKIQIFFLLQTLS